MEALEGHDVVGGQELGARNWPGVQSRGTPVRHVTLQVFQDGDETKWSELREGHFSYYYTIVSLLLVILR
jgi:hypothetical protein